MELKKITKTTHYVDSYDLAKYLSTKFPHEVEFIDTHNDSDFKITIKKGDMDKYDWESAKTFLTTGVISMEIGYNAVFLYIANEGWLEEGNYIIEFSW